MGFKMFNWNIYHAFLSSPLKNRDAIFVKTLINLTGTNFCASAQILPYNSDKEALKETKPTTVEISELHKRSRKPWTQPHCSEVPKTMMIVPRFYCNAAHSHTTGKVRASRVGRTMDSINGRTVPTSIFCGKKKTLARKFSSFINYSQTDRWIAWSFCIEAFDKCFSSSQEI